MNGIGYTISDVNTLIGSLKTGNETLKGAMESNWGEFASSFRREWVGEDEAAFEKTFSEELAKMYKNCENVINTAAQFIYNAADAWMKWQMQTASSLGGDGGQISGLEDFTPSDLTLEIPLSAQTFAANQTRGLQSDSSDSVLNGAIDTYVDAVKASLSSIQETLEAGNAFVGSEQKSAIDSFMTDIVTSAQNVTKMVNGFKTDTIPALVRAYKEQQTTTTGAVGEQRSSIESAVNEVTSGK